MRHVETVMGIPMSVDIRDDGDHSAAVRAAFDLLHSADKRFSTYSDESEIAAINRGEVMESEYSSDMRDVLALASQYEQSSGGAFTARVPGHGLDLNGIVKGWAVQAATGQQQSGQQGDPTGMPYLHEKPYPKGYRGLASANYQSVATRAR